MALTQDQWFNKLKGWVPQWFFASAQSQEAYFKALSLILNQLQEGMEEERNATFIMQADAPVLDLHGDERSVTRITDETDGIYKIRVQTLSNSVQKAKIKAIVDALLQNGECIIVEDFEGYAFLDREVFLERGEAILFADFYNTFSIIIDSQRPEPFSFLNRENFSDREDFMSGLSTPDVVFDAIINAVNDNKALGVLYRLVERMEA